MDKFDRVLALHRLLDGRRVPISHADLERELECSRATVTRTITFLRDRLYAPIEYVRDLDGYVYRNDGRIYSLPGLWFTSRELVALLAMHKFLGESGQGLLSEIVRPFRQKLQTLVERKHLGAGELTARVKILTMNARPQGAFFHVVSDALVNRKQLRIRYTSRSRNEGTQRTVSPQRLVHYRDVWYLDAWCHTRNGLRTFSVDRIAAAEVLTEVARDVGTRQLDEELSASYGIFSGAPTARAVLEFSAQAARWVAEETWHPDQHGEWLEDGRYRLTVPYAQDHELVADILRHGSEVRVVAPEPLRDHVARSLREALELYAAP